MYTVVVVCVTVVIVEVGGGVFTVEGAPAVLAVDVTVVSTAAVDTDAAVAQIIHRLHTLPQNFDTSSRAHANGGSPPGWALGQLG